MMSPLTRCGSLAVLVLCLLMPQDFTQAAKDNVEKKNEDLPARYKNVELFQKVLHYIEANYVDEINNTKLIHGAIKGMMETLDPHSNFLPEDIFRDMKVDTSGKFGGLGIEIGLRDGVLTVVSPIDGTPAWSAGIKAGDRIVKIDGESTKGLSLAAAVAKMRGKKGSKVILTIYRPAFQKPKDISLMREIINIKAVSNSEMIEPKYGYVRLATFNESATKDLTRAIERLDKEAKLSGLVLDLRSNPGGLLDQAVEVSSLFIDHGIIVSTIGRNKDQKEVKHAVRGKAKKDLPLAVLVNSSTASAAEIVAGALQDHRRAIIMGQPTFGKGSVQTVVELGEEMGLKLTIARYYTPSGRVIQENGLMPDILLDEYDPKLLEKAKITRDALREKDLPGHLQREGALKEFTEDELSKLGKKGDVNPNSSAEDDEMAPQKFDPKTDYQVKQAINFLKSHDVFQKMEVKETLASPGTPSSS